MTGDERRRTLVILDGGGRRELFVGEVSAPRISPDGQTLVARIDNPAPGLIVGQDTAPAGVWAFPIGGSRQRRGPSHPAWPTSRVG
ncbi:MAG: hypothetical protein WCJ55_19030 [Chloroflexales bacterium]